MRMLVCLAALCIGTTAWADGSSSGVAAVSARDAGNAAGIESTGLLTLPMARQFALARNTVLSAAGREVDAAQGALAQSAARPNPTVSYLLEGLRPETRTTTWQLSQPIELGGQRSARIAAAERGRDAAGHALGARRADVLAAVDSQFYELLAAQERQRLAQDAADLAARAAEVAARRAQAGKVAPIEETKARIAEAQAQLDLGEAEVDLAASRRRLSALWGNPAPRFERAEGKLDALPTVPAPEALEARLALSPLARLSASEVARRTALADLERAKRIPDLTVTLGNKLDHELGRNQTVIGVALPLPLFDSNRGNLTEALSRTEQARDEAAGARLRLQLEAAEARDRLAAARQQAELLGNQVLPAAQASLDATSRGYALGKFGLLDVFDAQRTLAGVTTQYLAALVQAHRAAAELDRLLGGPEAP